MPGQSATPEQLERDRGLDWVRAQTGWHERSLEPWIGIDRVYALSLPQRLDGLKRALSRSGLDGRVSILRAIEKDSLDLRVLAEHGILDRGRRSPPDAGEVACTLSHLAVLLDFWDSGADRCLIFEDDIEAKDNREATSAFLDVVSDLDWDMIYLSYSHARRDRSVRISRNLWQLRGQLCCNAYMLRRRSAEILLRAHLPYRCLVDQLYCHVSEAEDFLVLGPDERLFDQDRDRTGSTLKNRPHSMPPQWRPPLTDKLIARLLSIVGGRGSASYDERLLRFNHLPNGYLSHVRSRFASIMPRHRSSDESRLDRP